MKFPPVLCGLALLASVNLLFVSQVAAEDDPPPPPAPPPLSASAATIDFGSETTAHPRKHDSTFAQLALNPGQAVTIILQFDPSLSGQSVNVDVLDGGEITAPEQGLVIAQDGALQFQFQAGTNPGLVRIVVHQEGDGDTLEFWVIDNDNTDDNPAALSEN